MGNLTVKELIESGVHFGCRAARWNPQMAPYIHGRRNQLHVINLKETMRGILRAQNLLQAARFIPRPKPTVDMNR